MQPAIVVSDSTTRALEIVRHLSSVVPAQSVRLQDLDRHAPTKLTIIDVDLRGRERIGRLRRWLRARPTSGVVFVAVDQTQHIDVVRANAIGATDLIGRHCSRDDLLARLRSRRDRVPPGEADPGEADGIGTAIAALQNVFAAATAGVKLDVAILTQAADKVVRHIEGFGFTSWIKAARAHHDQTYQHCMLVCGSAAAFGQHVGFNADDRRRVALAGLLHDVGKAQIDVDLLNKRGDLDDAELASLKQHAELGYRALCEDGSLTPEMLDMILHHHEYLDGSGYPDRLSGSQISDLTRVITIVDIFSALIERRSYKAPIPGKDAHRILVDMGGRLDQHLVRAFQPLSLVQFA